MERERPQMTNENIQVFLRIRPTQEKASIQRIVLNVNAAKKEIQISERNAKHNGPAKIFTFNHIFDNTSKQVDVYRFVVSPLIKEILEGFSCTILAYGQTGSGKTFTVEGDCDAGGSHAWTEDNQTGIIPRVFSQLFDELSAMQVESTVKLTFLEIYKEEARDLLSAGGEVPKIKLFEDPARKNGMIIKGCREIDIKNNNQAHAAFKQGLKNRTIAATNMNQRSSRSHTILTLTVVVKYKTGAGRELLKVGKIVVVDLAGSENIERSGATENRAKEAGKINQGLLALGRVLQAVHQRAQHIPYRESTLTRLLHESVGGQSKTAIIGTISPVASDMEQTLSTLNYLTTAAAIKNRPVATTLFDHNELIAKLKQEIEQLRSFGKPNEAYTKMVENENELKKKLKIKTDECDNLKRELVQAVNLQTEFEKLKSVLITVESELTAIKILEQAESNKRVRGKENVPQGNATGASGLIGSNAMEHTWRIPTPTYCRSRQGDRFGPRSFKTRTPYNKPLSTRAKLEFANPPVFG